MQKTLNKLPKIVLTDIDGVWTDGGMYYDNNENEFKKFNTSDSAGVIYCKALNIPVGIITGENTNIVKRRSEKLNIEYLFQGVSNKTKVTQELINRLNIDWNEVAYIGDDIGDINLLRKVGISAAPANARDYVKKHVTFITKAKGGEGAFREFIETILIQNQMLDVVLEKYLENH
ncbi:MAG: HAD hydrolase family protein [Bacteroidales bacterium]|nr:HAD hydrolase family protein [Bacteroidales bacterium]